MPNRQKPQSQNNDRFWNFTKDEDTGENELLLYGNISSSQSWWDDDNVTHKQFAQELANLGNVDNITVRINSGGGDVFAANAIYALLKDNAANITVKIDGWAASAATIIAMAGDKIMIPKNGVMMIHNPSLMLWNSYTADDLNKMASELKVVKQSIVNAYMIKTGKSEDEISKLMDDETWYLGQDAVDNGFADEIMFDESADTVVENSNKFMVNNVVMDCSSYHVPIQLLNAQTTDPGEVNTHNIQEVETMPNENKAQADNKITTVDALKAKYPDLVAQIVNDATSAERTRIKDIENVALDGYSDIINDAKFENPQTAADVALKIVAAQKKQGADYLNKVNQDTQSSGVNDVPDDSQENPQDSNAIENALKNYENRKER